MAGRLFSYQYSGEALRRYMIANTLSEAASAAEQKIRDTANDPVANEADPWVWGPSSVADVREEVYLGTVEFASEVLAKTEVK